MTSGTFNFPKHKRGDTFHGFSFELELESDGTPIDLSGATIDIQFRKKPGSDIVLEWKTSDGSITITGTANNKINMLPKTGAQMDVESGTYKYDINVLKGGITNTYVEGEMQIVDDITRIP